MVTPITFDVPCLESEKRIVLRVENHFKEHASLKNRMAFDHNYKRKKDFRLNEAERLDSRFLDFQKKEDLVLLSSFSNQKPSLDCMIFFGLFFLPCQILVEPN